MGQPIEVVGASMVARYYDTDTEAGKLAARNAKGYFAMADNILGLVGNARAVAGIAGLPVGEVYANAGMAGGGNMLTAGFDPNLRGDDLTIHEKFSGAVNNALVAGRSGTWMSSLNAVESPLVKYSATFGAQTAYSLGSQYADYGRADATGAILTGGLAVLGGRYSSYLGNNGAKPIADLTAGLTFAGSNALASGQTLRWLSGQTPTPSTTANFDTLNRLYRDMQRKE